MENKIGVGLIGFGLAGRTFHAPFIANVPGLSLRKIRATNTDDIALAQRLYSKAEIVSDAAALFSDDAIELVVIASPNNTHYTLCKGALLAGKHVVVDKPFTVSTAEADELIRLAEKQNKLLTVYQNRRWDSDFKTIRKVLESDLLGKIVEYEAHFDRFRNYIKPATWKEEALSGSGILYDLGPHLIDQALCLFGLPDAITAEVKVQRENSNIVDYFSISLHYPQLKAILKAGMLVRSDLPRYMIYGEKGSFIKYGIDVQETALKAGEMPAETLGWGEEQEAIWGELHTTFKGLDIKGKIKSEIGDYSGFYINVCKAIKGEEPLAVKPEEARNVIRIIELAMQSNTEKRTISYS